ncbi:acetylserotonin O-methyltransferase [Nonomuraea sp. NBC_01738]|uniref:methyltransferase n=1 Tax=Nonomuraea sp. NBC_01738 TaxID=2976003 RepID=UPI002E12684D|nr:acetylserotonin O-methyltransferase [Nonomuraea sp. NBC_01738]
MLADYFGVLGFHALVAGARLGIFDALDSAPATPEGLALSLGLDHHGTDVLLRGLAGLGYVRSRRGVYRLTRASRLWLVSSSPSCLVEGLAFWERSACVYWPALEKAVRDGGPPVPFYTLTEDDPELSRSFQTWTAAVARRQAPATAAAIPVGRDARHMLDLGGSHAIYSLELLRLHPGLHATVVDLPQALESAQEHPRLRLHAGSFLDDELGEGYDVVLLFNIVHGLDDDQTARLLAKVALALNPGGTIVIGDQFRGPAPGRASRTLVDLLDLNYLVTIGGRIRPYREIVRLLRESGFIEPRHRRPLRSPATELAIATR